MRLKSRLHSILSSTSAEEKDIGNLEPRAYEISDALNEASSRTYRLADQTLNQAVDLAGLTSAQYILVRTDRAISVRINGTQTFPVGLITGFSYGWLLVTPPDGGVTSLDLSNSSGGAAKTLVQIAGEPA